MYAVVPRYPEYSEGEILVLSGRLTSPPSFSGFNYAAYLARQGVFSYMSFPRVTSLGRSEPTSLAGFIDSQREAARDTLQAAVAEPESSIAVGVVTGDRSSMSDPVKAAFANSGTTHILAISGENLSLLAGLVWLLYSGARVRRRMPVWLALAVITLLVIYTIFTGASPSVVRAAIMSTVLLMGPIVGRRYDPLAALSLSAAIMVLFDPDLLADAGFQLSFGAMLGIALISPMIQAFLTTIRIAGFHTPRLLAIPISVSLGAVIATLPISALVGGTVSLVGPFATLTADLALAPLMVAGILTVILGALGPQIAAIPGILTWVFSGWLLGSAQLWASLPFATIDATGISLAQVALYYALLSFAVLVLSSPARRAWLTRLRLTSINTNTLLAIVAVAVWATVVALFLF